MTIVSRGKKVKALTNSGGGDRPLGDVMREAHRSLVSHLEGELRRRGYGDVGAAHASVLATVDPAGIRLAGLVERGGRTKQATAELLSHLVGRGYLQVHPDPADGRAKVYTPTPAGTTLLLACAKIVTRYEAWLEEVLGQGGVSRLRHALSVIVEHADSAGVPDQGHARNR
jgi:DNA-binding MarR family transcriptional regulator